MTQFEITAPTNNETLAETTSQSDKFRALMSEMFGIDGQSPAERIVQLKQLSVEGVAILLEEINKQATGSDESMVSHDRTIKIGETATIAPEDRYSVFTDLICAIKDADERVSPERIADTLALGTVMLHPFKDGNGRTARMIGLMFRENYDASDFADDYGTVSSSRDELRQKGGWMINGYVPNLEGDQSNPADVSAYLQGLLTTETEGAYVSCFGEAPLYSDGSYDIKSEEEIKSDAPSLESRYETFAPDIDSMLAGGTDARFIGEGMRSRVYKLDMNDHAYAVRVVKPKKSYDTAEAVINEHIQSSMAAEGIQGLERVVAVSHDKRVVVSDFVRGAHMSEVSSDTIANISAEQIDELLAHRVEASRRGIKFDTFGENVLYDAENGFTDIDYGLGGQEMDAFKAMCTIFESMNLISQIELEHDPARKQRLTEQNLAIYGLIGRYCKSRFSDELRDRLANQFQVIRANMIAHAKHKE